MKLTFFGAAKAVTGSCHCVEVNGHKVLVDCGLQQGRDERDNRELDFVPGYIDDVVVTHAHIDHSGRLPLLVKQGFAGNIYCTRLTAQLLSIMLRDSAQIQENDAAYENQKGKRAGKPPVEPLYTLEDVEKTLRHIVTCEYGWELDISDGIKIRFVDAGHLLGSACVEMWLTEQGFTKKIVFSGDIGNRKQPIIRSPQPITEADYVVTESTYGDRLHNVKEKPNYADDLARVIDETLAKGGNLVIPSFAVGRTQELLYFIREIKEQGLVDSDPDFQVYVDSPLAGAATEIFSGDLTGYLDEEAIDHLRGDALFRRTGGAPVRDTDELSQPPFLLNTRNRTLEKNGKRVKLTQVEYSIVKLFMENPGKALSREEILEAVWGTEFLGELKIVDVNIRRLRIKLEDDPQNPSFVITVWGFGYKWVCPDTADKAAEK